MTGFQTKQFYLDCKQKLETIYTQKINDIRVRSKCKWCEDGEKSTKFCLNLEKHSAAQGSLCTIIVNRKEIHEPSAISNKLYDFYQTLFKEKLSLSEESIQSFLDKVSLPKLNDNQALECEGVINENKLLKVQLSWIMIKHQGMTYYKIIV